MQFELDKTQKEAVECPDRAVMVVAGPGTGKTRVLTARAAWLINELDADPSRILAITYTNRAAGEMRSRLSQYSRIITSSERESAPSLLESQVTVMTFHSLAYRLIKMYFRELGFEHEPVVFDENATEQLLSRLMLSLRIPEDVISVRNIKTLLDRVKARIAYPLCDPRVSPEYADEVSALLRAYQNELVERGAVDFADILISALNLLLLNPEIRKVVSSSIDHLLIDEFQDINPAQYRLIDALVSPETCIFAVGDEDQTIYGFRGSSGEFIDSFVADYQAHLIPLGSSYRCPQALLYTAGTLISRNRHYYLQPPNPPRNIRQKPPLLQFEVEDEHEEASLVVKLINKWVNENLSYKDIVILYRIHNLADECERKLLEKGIPILRLTPDRQRKPIPDDPLPLLRLAVSNAEWDWDKALGLPHYMPGELDDLRVRSIALQEQISIPAVLNKPTRFRHLSYLAQNSLRNLNGFIRRLRKESVSSAPSGILHLIYENLRKSRPPWRPQEDAWLEKEQSELSGFDLISPSAIIEEWQNSKDGLRIYHAASVSALSASLLLASACRDIFGVKAETIPLSSDPAQISAILKDHRPCVLIGLNFPPELFFPDEYLLPHAIYIHADGISTRPPAHCVQGECFRFALAAHRLASELVAYRPGGDPGEELVFFDLETTGTDIYSADIVELAGVRIHFRNHETVELGYFYSLVNPGRPIPRTAVSIHGITDEHVKNAPSIKEVLPGFLEFIGNSPIAGHNINEYDLPILRRFAGRMLNRVIPNLTLDTLAMARRLFPGESHTLTALARKLGISVNGAHRALDDVRTNIRIFQKMTRIEQSFSARAHSPIAPVMLAIANAFDENSEIDPSMIYSAASRKLASIGDDIQLEPLIISLTQPLTPSAKKRVESILFKLSKISVETTEEEEELEQRFEFLLSEAVELEKTRPNISLGDYLAHIALLSESDFKSEEDAVKMMTLHASKGLEFEKVIILGLEQGHLPHRLALNKTVNEIEEERRLCYVGITRARSQAVLIYARRRFGKWRLPSMFLSEFPPNATKKYRTKDKIKGK